MVKNPPEPSERFAQIKVTALTTRVNKKVSNVCELSDQTVSIRRCAISHRQGMHRTKASNGRSTPESVANDV